MRKIFTTLFLLSACYMSSFSQVKNNFDFGVIAGYNFASAQNGMGSTVGKSGFNAGAFGDYYFTDRWSVKVKLSYDQKGWDKGFITNLNTGQSFQTNYHLNYLTIPILASYHFGKKRNWYLHMGPYVGLLLNAKESQFNTDLKDFIHNTEYGLDLGIGVKFPIAENVKLLLELDGQSGFTDVFKSSTDGTKATNARSSINLGVAFAIK